MNERSHTTGESFPPSYFANRGQPMCSRWGKSEIEWIAHAYVKALAKDGDVWKRLSREQVLNLISGDELGYVETMLRLDNERYKDWFDAVADQISDAEGAFGVRGFWNKPYPRPDEHQVQENTNV